MEDTCMCNMLLYRMVLDLAGSAHTAITHLIFGGLEVFTRIISYVI
jgi:hypothetical protein